MPKQLKHQTAHHTVCDTNGKSGGQEKKQDLTDLLTDWFLQISRCSTMVKQGQDTLQRCRSSDWLKLQWVTRISEGRMPLPVWTVQSQLQSVATNPSPLACRLFSHILAVSLYLPNHSPAVLTVQYQWRINLAFSYTKVWSHNPRWDQRPSRESSCQSSAVLNSLIGACNRTDIGQSDVCTKVSPSCFWLAHLIWNFSSILP